MCKHEAERKKKHPAGFLKSSQFDAIGLTSQQQKKKLALFVQVWTFQRVCS